MRLNAVLQIGAGENRSDSAAHLERRGTGRRTLTLKTLANSTSGEELTVTIQDISAQGFLIKAESDALSEGEVIKIDLPEKGTMVARVVWASSRHFGCRLDEAISPGAIGAALLRADARVVPDETMPAARSVYFSPRVAAGGFEPELNFSVAAYITLLLWSVAGLAIYFAVR